jgi:ATP-dependent helicase/nuclease subunit B
LATYLNCPLKFYYRYLLGLKEKEELEHSMAAHTFGKVVHKTLETLYAPFVGKEVSAEDIAPMFADIHDVTENVFRETTHTSNHEHGKNYLLLRVINDLVAKLLEIDLANAPFTLIALEETVEATLVTGRNPEGVKIAGVMDRVDNLRGQVRIIDYKTGKANDLKLGDFEEIREGDKKREAFQVAMYAWLHLKGKPMDATAIVGIYQMRNLSKGLTLLQTGPTLSPVQDMRALLPFEDLLAGILDEIFDLDTPFVQTEDEKRCEYCAYKVMCVRT